MDETILQQVAFLRHATTNWLKHWKSAILGMRGEKKQKLVWKFHRDGIFCENKMDENIMIANNMMKRFASVPLFQSKVKSIWHRAFSIKTYRVFYYGHRHLHDIFFFCMLIVRFSMWKTFESMAHDWRCERLVSILKFECVIIVLNVDDQM